MYSLDHISDIRQPQNGLMLCRLLSESQSALERTGMHHAASTTRAACVEALAIATFVGGESDADAAAVMTHFAGLWNSGTSSWQSSIPGTPVMQYMPWQQVNKVLVVIITALHRTVLCCCC